MRFLDRVFQRWRIAKVAPHVPRGSRVLDVGCGDGALLRTLRAVRTDSVGIDPQLSSSEMRDGVRLLRGRFPEDFDMTAGPFDVVAMLAVFEHLDDDAQDRAIEASAQLLRPGGRLVMTVPEPVVDRIVRGLARIGLVDGMALHEHHGFAARETPEIVQRGPFDMERHDRFEIGLNHLFVFRRR